jgi:O-antigen/teichoic acid export membrane protein
MASDQAEKPPRVEISKKLVMLNSSSSLVASVLSLTVLVWLQQYLLKRISPEEYSLLPVVYSVMVFAPLASTTLTSGLLRFTAGAYAVSDSRRVSQIVSTMGTILLLSSCPLLFVGTGIIYYISDILTIAPEHLGDARLMLALLFLSFCIRLTLAPFNVGLAIRQKYVVLNMIRTCGQLVRMAVLFALLMGLGARVLWVVVATTLTESLVELLLAWLSVRAVPLLRFRWRDFNWHIARQVLGFGGWSTVSGLAANIQMSASVIILNKLATPLDLSCFHLGSLPVRHMTYAASVAQGPMTPALVAIHATGEVARFPGIYLKVGRWSLWASLFLAIPLMVYGREIMTVYVGSEYRMAGTVMCLLLLRFPVSEGVRMLFAIADAQGRIRRLALYLLVMGFFNVALTLYLVGVLKLGAVGAALGTTAAIGIGGPLLLWPLGSKMAQVPISTWVKKTLCPGLLPAAVCAMVLGLLRATVTANSWLTIFLCVSAGSAVYILTLLFAGLQREDWKEMRKAYLILMAWPMTERLMRRFSKQVVV